MLFTIFTPTYNRKKLLKRVYKSICNQKYQDLEWVIQDDGSSDGTREMICQWRDDKTIDIKYHFQENQGRFAAYNNAVPYFNGELVILLDSDNILLENALQILSQCWNRLGLRKSNYSGIIAYMNEGNNSIVGSRFPKKLKSERIYVLYDKYKLTGDKFLVFRNDLVQKYRYPIFPGENFGGDAFVFNKMNEEFPMYILRRPIIERGDFGESITRNLIKYHLTSPNGMREHYKDSLEHEKYSKKNIFKHCIGYIAYSKMTGIPFKDIIKMSPYKIITFLIFPLGYVYFIRCIAIKRIVISDGKDN